MKGSRYFASKDVKGTADQNEKEDRTTESEASKFEKRQKNKKNSKAQPEVVHNLSDIDFTTARFPRKRLKKPQSILKKEGKVGRPWRHSKTQRKSLREEDPYPDKLTVPKEKVQKYKRGEKLDISTVKTDYHQARLKSQEKKVKTATKKAARAELLLPEDAGFLEADDGEMTCEISQRDIVKEVDITSMHKFFELKLDKFGPYRMNYTRNGRQLLFGGGKGHVAALDWHTKKLMCEMNVMETVTDVQWLHIETMFAVAQKTWTYIYDNQGIELHCLKALDQVLRLEFLPYHFLLVSANAKSYLSWLDISVGQKVSGFGTGLGRLDVMCQNPKNAIIHLGHSGGTVTLWSPNQKQPLVKMLCHGGGTRSIAVHNSGDFQKIKEQIATIREYTEASEQLLLYAVIVCLTTDYMATSGIDRKLKIWDLRMYKEVQSCGIGVGAGALSFSQRGLLAAGLGNIVEVYKDPCRQPVTEPYMNHRLPSTVQNLQFCPYEDVLGVGHTRGFASLLIPGAGEPNFDALEANPYQSKKQRRQAEVKMLLEKVQPEMISLDTSVLGQVDTKTLQQSIEEKTKLKYLKPQKIDFEPRHKKKGKSKTGKVEKRKKGVQFEHKRQQIKEFLSQKRDQDTGELSKPRKTQAYNVFDRFKHKDA